MFFYATLITDQQYAKHCQAEKILCNDDNNFKFCGALGTDLKVYLSPYPFSASSNSTEAQSAASVDEVMSLQLNLKKNS